MELGPGKVAVVTGGASGIGLALAHRFAGAGMAVVLADIEAEALATAGAAIRERGVEVLEVVTDVSKAEGVEALRDAAVERFGTIHVVCNNAGVVSSADAWLGPISVWEWVFGVNLWGVIHGIRAFLPILVGQGEGHIVNTASMAGLLPGFGPIYDATKHAVVAISEDLWRELTLLQLGVGVTVLCPGWVNTNLIDADRNWVAELGERPPDNLLRAPVEGFVRRALAEGMTPAAVADVTATAVQEGRFWAFPHPEFVALAAQRWLGVAVGLDPALEQDVPGMPTLAEIVASLIAPDLPA